MHIGSCLRFNFLSFALRYFWGLPFHFLAGRSPRRRWPLLLIACSIKVLDGQYLPISESFWCGSLGFVSWPFLTSNQSLERIQCIAARFLFFDQILRSLLHDHLSHFIAFGTQSELRLCMLFYRLLQRRTSCSSAPQSAAGSPALRLHLAAFGCSRLRFKLFCVLLRHLISIIISLRSKL